jgi:hypothetical protein
LKVKIGVALAVVAGGAALGHAAASKGAAAQQAQGGLSIQPAKIEQGATPGALGPLVVANRSGAPLQVTVTARPWTQASSGKVAADRKKTLAGISVATPSFTLAAGETKTVGVSLTGVPAGGALYGALEVIGLPTDAATRKGVVLGYRLIDTLRLLPATKVYKLTAGKVTTAKGTASVAIKNSGNTIDPITASIVTKGAGSTRRGAVDSLRILPGKTVGIPLGKGLQKGSYTSTVTIQQNKKTALKVPEKFKLK